MFKQIKKVIGFTLIEMMLVLVIISAIIYAAIGYMQQRTMQMQIDRTSIQMQQILNAALAYYVTNGTWPSGVKCLQGMAASGSGGAKCNGNVQYLPTNLISPFGNVYRAASNVSDASLNVFYVYTSIPPTSSQAASASATAGIIAGTLPLAYTSGDKVVAGTPPAQSTACDTSGGKSCAVVASVNIPGQNLNNATAVNFAGVYNHGACIPAPQCPVDSNGNTMTPEVIVVPVSVGGYSDPSSTNVYPISSFTGYAEPLVSSGQGPSPTPPACINGTQVACTPSTGSVPPGTVNYWRACLRVTTEKGDVAITSAGGSPAWGQNVTLVGITRCAPPNEFKGSSYMNVFSQ